MRPPRRPAVRFVPVALLVLGIAVHGVRIEAFHEDPQRGTAFAMFATVDIGANRRVVATAPGDPTIVLALPDTLGATSERLTDSPSDDSARELAERLLEQTWEVDDDTATIGGDTTFDQVRVQVVGPDADGRTVSRQVFTDVVVGSRQP